MAPRVSSPVMIGRAAELERLATARRQLDLEGSQAVLVAGEAGVGKTRLVAEFSAQARAEGTAVLQGGCIELGDGALPYAPVVEALRGLVRGTPSDDLDALMGHGRTELARLVPDLGPVADHSTSALNIGSAQGRLFELLLGVLERLAARGPLLFVVEDLHWSDRSTRDLLGFLVRNLRDAPVLLVFTYRSDELHRRHPLLPFLAELERSGRVERLELRPFDRYESSAQLRAIAGHDLEPALIDSIHARAGGNAFFVEELLVAAGSDGRAELPPTLRDVLLARVVDLAEPTQEFLRIASAAGQRVDPALLADALDLDASALGSALRESVGRQVLVADSTAGADRYAFRHALVQEAIYDDLLPGERTRLHSAFARTLEVRAVGDVTHAGELAYHWNAAHDLPRAVAASVAAGRTAEASYAFPEALVHYERAVGLWDRVPGADALAGCDLIDLLAALAGVARFQEPARAVTHVQEAIRLAEASGDAVRSGLLHERLGRYAWLAGQGQVAREAYATATRLIPGDPPSAERARALAGYAQILMLGARFDISLTLADEALDLARAVGARDIEGHALNTRGHDRAAGGEIEAGLEEMRAALAIAEEVGVVDDIGRAYANWVWILDVSGRLDEAIALGEVGIATAERLGLMRLFGSHMVYGVADQLYRLGRWDESDRILRRAEEAGPFGINAILVEEMRGRLAVAFGDFDEAAARLQPLASLAARTTDTQFVCPVESSLAELALWTGRARDAVDRLAAAIAMIDFSPEVRVAELHCLAIRANADLAELARARRRTDEAEAAIAAGDAAFEAIRRRHLEVETARPVFAPQSEAWLRLAVAEASRLHRQPDPDAWLAVAEAWTQLGRPYPVAYARWREAEARLAARGDRGLATAAVRAALATATDLGAAPLARELRALATRARLAIDASGDGVESGEPVALDEGAALGLTAREHEVLALVALGRTNRQIADELFISENTAGVHVSNILGKLGVSSRGEAAALAYRLGLVAASSDEA